MTKSKQHYLKGDTANGKSKIFGINWTSCDTLRFQEGDLFMYYDFIFKEGKLSRIEISSEK